MRHPRHLKSRLWVAATAEEGVRIRCAFCPARLSFAEATVDHEPPLSLGGRPDQAVLACLACNQRRSGQTTEIVNQTRRRTTGGKQRPKKKRRRG